MAKKQQKKAVKIKGCTVNATTSECSNCNGSIALGMNNHAIGNGSIVLGFNNYAQNN